jgi:hypothetical protein
MTKPLQRGRALSFKNMLLDRPTMTAALGPSAVLSAMSLKAAQERTLRLVAEGP